MLSENIRKFRMLCNLSQQDLAEKVHVTRQTVSKWERGQSVPDADLLAPIAESFGIRTSDLLGERISEETSVCKVGSEDETACANTSDVSPDKINPAPKKKLKTWEIVLLTLGSPIWVPLLLAAFSIFLSLYVVLWSGIIILWAAFASVLTCGLFGVAGGAYLSIENRDLSGLAVIGAGIACTGLSIFLFFGCNATTKGILRLTKKIARRIHEHFIQKEDV